MLYLLFIDRFRNILPGKSKIGDVIYSRIGTIGKVRKVTEDIKFQVSYSLCLIRPASLLRTSDLLYWFLQSPLILGQALAKRRSIGVPDLGLGNINEFLITLPPLAEHCRIVEEIEHYISLADRIGKIVEQSINQAWRLR